MPNNWITAWFIASFQFGLCLQRVCFLRNLNRCVIFYCILVGEIPATEPNWIFFWQTPGFGTTTKGFPPFLRGPVIVHHHFTTSVPFGDARVSRDDPAIPGDLQRRRNPWNKMPSSAPMPFYAPKQGRSLRWLGEAR